MISYDQRFPRRKFLRLLGGAAALAGGSGLVRVSPLHRLLAPEEVLAAAGGRFPMETGLAGRILREAQSRGAGFGEIYLEDRTVTRLTLVGGLVESVEQGIYSGCGVRAVDEDRTGYAYADTFEEGALLAAARDAATIAAGAAREGQISAFALGTAPALVTCRRSFETVTEDERVGWLRQADAAARAYDPSVNQVSIEHTDEMLHFLVINSDGTWIEDTLPLLYMRLTVMADKGGRRGTGVERLSQRMGAEQTESDAPAVAAREAARMAVAMCEAQEAPAGDMPVILGAGGGVMFHEAVGHGLEGDAVRKGTSAFAGRVGQVVGSDRVSVVDTGALPLQRGSYNVDDEGFVPQRNLLIDRGVLRGFLNDRITALALGAPRTGNGRRQSYRYPPLVRMSNTFLLEGQDTLEEMLKGTKSGLFARTLGGGEVDTTTGNFTFGVLEGYRIEDGRITAPVRGANLVGNGPEIMKRIDRVGPDQKFWAGTCGKGQWVPVGSGAPTLRISSMTVGGSRQE
jgi:TldD protein